MDNGFSQGTQKHTIKKKRSSTNGAVLTGCLHVEEFK